MIEFDVAAMQWRKSTRSGQGGSDCVEVARLPGAIAVRDSKNLDSSVLAFKATDFGVFVTAIRSGRLDR